MSKQWLCASLVTLTAAGVQAQTVVESRVLAPFVGRLATAAPGQSAIGVYGTDVGYSLQDGNRLIFLFGDTLSTALTPIGLLNDDIQGEVSLSTFPTGDVVETYVRNRPPQFGELPWQSDGPPVTFRTAFGSVAPVTVYRDGLFSQSMGALNVVKGAFGNARGAGFGVFTRFVAAQCSGGLFPACASGLVCDRGMGICLGTSGDTAAPCVLGTTRCACVPALSGGMCRDVTSSVSDESEDGRMLSVAQVMEVGSANLRGLTPDRYASQPWVTNKFLNTAAQTVDDFDPNRVNGVGNVYREADGVNPSREKVFIWGRPGIAASAANDRSLGLYLMYMDMPNYDPAGHFAWSPRYFMGSVNGKPTFSTRQSDAVPLNLSAAGDPTVESRDIVAELTVTWVEPLKKWVMFYGGDWPPLLLSLYNGDADASSIAHDPNGAIVARFADQPWGPWSPSVSVFRAGNPAVSPPAPGTQYAPGGILYHPQCFGSCAPGELNPFALFPPNDAGRLYGANIIDSWTTDRGAGVVDLYWNVSTWAPYGVVLMKTRIRR